MRDDVSVGRQVKDVRLARNLRQADVASRAGLSRSTVSRLELGQLEGLTVGSIRAISRVLRMPPLLEAGWRGPEFDRLRDAAHAAMVEMVVSALRKLGWEVKPEHSFNYFGERGSADVLAWQSSRRALLIVETKTRLWDLQDALSSLDRKRRVLPGLVARELGWGPRVVGVVLVLPETRTHRRFVERHRVTIRAALPAGQIRIRGWLAEPDLDVRGIWFLTNDRQMSIRHRCPPKRRRAGANIRQEPARTEESTALAADQRA